MKIHQPFMHSLKNRIEMNECIGIIAGKGKLVQQIAESCQANQKNYLIIAFEGQTDADLLKNHPHVWAKLAKVGQTLNLLKQHHVSKIVMAGRFQRPSWHQLKVDSVGFKWVIQLSRAFGDDSLLKIIINLLEKEGFKVISPEDIIGQILFIKPGPLTCTIPDSNAMLDIKRGQHILQQISALDIGQAAVIQQGVTLAIEGVEGTDALIKRCFEYIKPGPGPILIKACKQDQETRVDRATVGPQTLEYLIQAKFAGLAVQAYNVIVLDAPSMKIQADCAGLFIYAI